ncbi:hypothetical protein HAX54_045208 [Datura stramonium]|uniref:Uncharacterized protein n=1 Tax=Datura stramonium TaxID=4076 RepID=A0ABS8WHE8_DATST|nr:hypothetical protein [Datura stramonium]
MEPVGNRVGSRDVRAGIVSVRAGHRWWWCEGIGRRNGRGVVQVKGRVARYGGSPVAVGAAMGAGREEIGRLRGSGGEKEGVAARLGGKEE